MPTLVVQGTRDSVVRAAQTQKLLRRFPNRVQYVEVDSEHDLTLAENPVWPQVEAAVVGFARVLRMNSQADKAKPAKAG
jgi:pimeloyl-ACP methyl ester carboxylesterase